MQIIKPTLKDIVSMQTLVAPEVQSGVILERSFDEMASAIRSYNIAQDDNNDIIGFCALHIHSSTLAEIRSLIVSPLFRGKKIASLLIQYSLQEASELGIQEVLVLTYQRILFEKLGFQEIHKAEIPNQKIWADCIKCKHFPICDEIALIKKI